MKISRKTLSAPKIEYAVEQETGAGWCAGICFPVFTVVARCGKRINAQLMMRAAKRDRPSLDVRIVKWMPTIIAELRLVPDRPTREKVEARK